MRKNTALLSIIFVMIALIIGVYLGSIYLKNKQSVSQAKPVIPQNQTSKTNPTPAPGLLAEQTQMPVEEQPGIPVEIIIPSIRVDANVEQVGMDAQGKMDVPRSTSDTAWYNLGVRPGMVGNSVIDGHLDTTKGASAVFYNLKDMSIGDKIQLKDDNGKIYTFQVTGKESYPYDNFPMEKVFGDSNQKMLNLITCDGYWNRSVRSYSDRIVIYSQLVS